MTDQTTGDNPVITEAAEQPSEAEKRIKDLSGKVKSASEERDAANTAREAADAKAAEAEKRAQFAEQFSDVVVQNPAAKDFKADIQAKVLGGYTLQDATYAVLGAAGKLGQPAVERKSPSGGSADNSAIQNTGTKTVAEMTQAERRAALVELEKQGIISVS